MQIRRHQCIIYGTRVIISYGVVVYWSDQSADNSKYRPIALIMEEIILPKIDRKYSFRDALLLKLDS